MNKTLWMEAVEAHLEAYRLISKTVELVERSDPPLPHQTDNMTWRIDKDLLSKVVPYVWSTETTEAVLAASKSIPLDTHLNTFNLPQINGWWYFETPLPFNTLIVREDSTVVPRGAVKALCFGSSDFFREWSQHRGMPVCAWVAAPEDLRPISSITPSQTFEWDTGSDATLGSMLEGTRIAYIRRYGTEASRPTLLGADQFMLATECMAKFLLAASVWLSQKVVVASDGHIERHRRKDASRAMNRDYARNVQIIQLRKSEHTRSEAVPADDKREFHCRWVVDGHWRNQPYGAHRASTRLQWINPYVKGPDDMPLKGKPQKVFLVER